VAETDKKIDFRAAIREGIARFKGEWVEPVVEEVCTYDYPALNRVFDKVAEALKVYSGGRAIIGHRIEPKINGDIDAAAAQGIGGKFTLLIKHSVDDNFQFEVGSLKTSANGFPATLLFPRQNHFDPSEIECKYDEHLKIALGCMISELKFGTALKAIMDHDTQSQECVTLK
jgi:hypothetical protein